MSFYFLLVSSLLLSDVVNDCALYPAVQSPYTYHHFSQAILDSDLYKQSSTDTADHLFSVYHSTLTLLADKFAPLRETIKRRQRLAPWFDDQCHALRRRSRMLERRYRRQKTEESRLEWVTHERKRHEFYRQRESLYWTACVSSNGGNPRKLWRIINTFLSRKTNDDGTKIDLPTATQLLDFFADKVRRIRAAGDGLGRPLATLSGACSTLDSFPECNVQTVEKLISASSSASSDLDPIPTSILKDHLPQLLPYITMLCNASLRDGFLPSSQKTAIVRPIIKKDNLDPTDPKNYRPISNLTFISKLIERVVALRLTEHLTKNELLPMYQSAYRKHHSTETSVISLLSNIYDIIDTGNVALLGLLDLSAAFDCVDHNILIDRLSQTFGIRNDALAWLSSFLCGRTQTVFFNGLSSSIHNLDCGVPQGSVLGPLLFILYTSEVEKIVQRWGFKIASYADDIQILGHSKAENPLSLVNNIVACINDLDQWMFQNRLKLNPDKTQFVWFGTRQRLKKITIKSITLGSASINIEDSATVLGVTLDSELTMLPHIKQSVKSCFFQLRSLWSIRRFITRDIAKTLVHAFVLSKVDYCNSALSGVAMCNLRRLQSVMNAAARFISMRRKFDHISDFLHDELHWLNVEDRISYKLCLFVYRCLQCRAPPYLSCLCRPLSAVAGRPGLRSADRGDLFVPRTSTNIGSRSFSVAGPTLWNSLPLSLRDRSLSIDSFKSTLKTHFFLLH